MKDEFHMYNIAVYILIRWDQAKNLRLKKLFD